MDKRGCTLHQTFPRSPCRGLTPLLRLVVIIASALKVSSRVRSFSAKNWFTVGIHVVVCSCHKPELAGVLINLLAV